MKNWQNCKNEEKKYKLYLCSREWCEKREIVKERSQGICERCKINKSKDVHHLTYENKYNELLEDLQDICFDCHKFIHAKSDYDPCKVKGMIVIAETRKDAFYLRKLFPYVLSINNVKTIPNCESIIFLFNRLDSQKLEYIKNVMESNSAELQCLSAPSQFTSYSEFINKMSKNANINANNVIYLYIIAHLQQCNLTWFDKMQLNLV